MTDTYLEWAVKGPKSGQDVKGMIMWVKPICTEPTAQQAAGDKKVMCPDKMCRQAIIRTNCQSNSSRTSHAASDQTRPRSKLRQLWLDASYLYTISKV